MPFDTDDIDELRRCVEDTLDELTLHEKAIADLTARVAETGKPATAQADTAEANRKLSALAARFTTLQKAQTSAATSLKDHDKRLVAQVRRIGVLEDAQRRRDAAARNFQKHAAALARRLSAVEKVQATQSVELIQLGQIIRDLQGEQTTLRAEIDDRGLDADRDERRGMPWFRSLRPAS
ncbi:MAG: hypothetical protein AAFR55_05020 [Pseudomonadota bacterium]